MVTRHTRNENQRIINRNFMEQWKEFVVKNKVILLKSCFSNWQAFCTTKKRWVPQSFFPPSAKKHISFRHSHILLQANWRRSKMRLNKALTAWKRFVPTMRRERSRQFFIENRHNLLVKAHWYYLLSPLAPLCSSFLLASYPIYSISLKGLRGGSQVSNEAALLKPSYNARKSESWVRVFVNGES